ncbi:hypothetical protein AgCh_031359 [Apium graveolens]
MTGYNYLLERVCVCVCLCVFSILSLWVTCLSSANENCTYMSMRSLIEHWNCSLHDMLRVYLSKESSEGSCESYRGHEKLAMSDSGHSEGKACITKASVPNHAIQAFRLLKESAAAQTVASIASDPNVWTAVMENEALLEYFQSQDTGMNSNLNESPVDAEILGYQSHKFSDDEAFDEKEPKKGFNSFLKDIKSRVEDMLNSCSSFFQNLFTGPAAADGSAKVDKTMGASIMVLVVMVIMVVVLKRV